MNTSLYTFLALVLTIVGGSAWFFRGTLAELGNAAKDHAKLYAVAYAKGGALILIATGASFDETFKSLTKMEAMDLPWWIWVSLFWKPIGAGLAVLVAFLDRSVQRALESETKPPAP